MLKRNKAEVLYKRKKKKEKGKSLRLSLKFKTAVCIVLALGLGFLSAYLIINVGDDIIDKYYLTEELMSKREQKYAEMFNKYVKDNNIKSTDYSKIKQWCSQKKYLYFMLFDDDSLMFVVDGNNSYKYEDGEITDISGYTMHTVSFADGTYNISLIEYSEDIFYNIVTVGGFAIGVLIAFLIILNYLSRLTKRIRLLSSQVTNLEINEQTSSLKPDKNDEIGDLYEAVEDMRNSIIYHYENERKTLSANKELITNMSHDIRTPLTSIIGYNEIILAPGTSPDDMRKYARYSLDKANQLKDMSDKLFKYFLVYNSDEIKTDIKPTSALFLIQQIVSEQTVFLSQKGYKVIFTCNIGDIEIHTDAVLLKRVFDNVFSNITKYARNDVPVKVVVSFENKTIQIMIIDYISPKADKTQSTGIGLKSCENIMHTLGGSFTTQQIDDMFVSLINIDTTFSPDSEIKQ